MANWFAYNGVGDIFLPSSYRRSFTKPTCISGGCTICAIYLDDNSTGSPATIDADVLAYLSSAATSLVPQPADSFKRFVYVKSC